MKKMFRTALPLLCFLLFSQKKIAAQPLTVTITGNNEITCQEPCTYLNAEATGGTAPYAYQWAANGNNFPTVDQSEIMVCQPGLYTVVVTSTATGVTATATFAVYGSTNPPYVTTTVQHICGNSYGTVMATVANGSCLSSFYWAGPGGFTSTQLQIQVSQPGTYTLTAADCQTGCTAVSTATVLSFPDLPDITSNNPAPCNNPNAGGQNTTCEKTCPGQTVTYSINYQTATALNWQISGAASYTVAANKKIATVTWGGSGGGQVAVFRTGTCPDSSARCIEVTDAPIAIISSSPATNSSVLTVCENQPVYFENKSVHSETVEWDFGDFSPKKADQNPVHSWPVAGTYDVKLIARSPCLCADTTFLKIVVQPGKSPTLDCLGTVCLGTEVTYSVNENCGSYAWAVSPSGKIIGGGGPSDGAITVQWASGDLGEITLTALNCSPAVCPMPAVFQVPLISDFAEIKGDQRICRDEESIYEVSPFGGANFVWKLASGGQISSGQGTNRVKIKWTATANFNTTHWLSVSYDNCYLGCGGTDSIAVKILPKYRATGPLEVCESASGNFSGQTIQPTVPIALNWELQNFSKNTVWTASNSTPQAIPFTFGPGVFYLKTTPADPNKTCTDEYEMLVQVKSPPAAPTAILGENKICPGQPYTYNIVGAAPGSNVVWQVSGGTPAAQQGENSVVNWNPAGPYSILAKNVSADALGCSSQFAGFVAALLPAPKVAGDAAVCSQTEGSYSATLFQNLDYQWIVSPADAGTVSDGQGTNAAKIFWSKPGNHQVSVSVCGQTGVFNVLVRALPEPVPVFPNILCENTVAPVSVSQPFSKYFWKNDDGATASILASPPLGPGHFGIEVEDVFGCRGNEVFNIDVRPVPDLNLTSPDLQFDCPILPPVRMYATDTDEGLDFQWFMNGAPVGTNSNFYQNTFPANYQVVATDSEGCTALSNVLTISACGTPGPCNPSTAGCPNPIPLDFNIVPTAVCNARHYDGIMSPTAVPGSQLWLFEHFPSSTQLSLDKTYPKAGYEKIIFSAQFGANQCGIFKADGVPVAADFKSKTACAGQVFDFEDISTYLPPNAIASWAWDFGDPASGAANVSSLKNPAHTFQTPGDFTVNLVVTSSTGCTSGMSKTIKVAPLPTAAILPPATNCAGNALQFLANSPTGDISTWEWDFGDPASGDLNKATVNPAFHKFQTAGSYPVSLKIKNIFGCENTVSKPQTVAANPLAGTIAMLPASGKICEGKSATLNSPPGGTSWLWNTGSTANSLTINQKGNFRLTITDANGCTFSPPDAVVDVLPAPDAVVNALEKNDLGYVVALLPSPVEVCQGQDVFLQTSGNGASYSYSWPDGTTGVLDEFSETRNNLLATGTHNFTVTITNSTTGCTNTAAPFSVTVNPTPTGVAIVSNKPAPVCGHQIVVLSVAPPSAANTYEWNTGQGGAFLQTDEAGNYSVVATNSFGCSATSNTIQILPGAPIESVPSGCHTRCAPDTVCFTPPPSAVSWQWFLNGTAVPGATVPNLVATAGGDYQVLITDASGCTAFSEPLSLNILPGYGSIVGNVFWDKNLDGIFNGSDEFLPNLSIILFENGTPKDTDIVNAQGFFSFIDLPEKGYKVAVDTASLGSLIKLVWTADVTVSGCDDLDVLNFTFDMCDPSVPTFLTLTTCPGLPVFYQNQSINGGQSKDFMLKNGAGCDSLVTVSVVEFAQIAPQTVQLTTCDSVFFNQKWLAAGISESFVFQSQNGCDSMVTAVVTGLPSAASSLNLSACDSAFYANNWLPVGSQKLFNFKTINGCDSVVTVSVTGLPGLSSAVNLSACAGSSAVFNGTPIAAGQSKIFVFQSAAGCDSTVTVQVSAIQPTNSTVNLAACPGSSAIFSGQNVAAGTSKTFVLTNAAGCDSTILVKVATLQPTSSTVNLAACPGGFAVFQNQNVAAGASQSFVLQNAAGCDSTVLVNVATLLPTSSTVNLAACPGGFAVFNNQNIAAGASQTFILPNAAGCDSTVLVNVATLLPTSSTVNLAACPGDFAVFNNQNIAAGASQTFTLPNAAGCDSTILVNVATLLPTSSTVNLAACPGDFAVFNNQNIAAGASQTFILPNAAGCDSTILVKVATLQPTSSMVNLVACPGSSALFNGQNVAAGTSKTFILPNAAGCDSTILVKVATLAPTSSTVNLAACPGTSADFNGNQIPAGSSKSIILQNAAGCDSTILVAVAALPAMGFEVTTDSACFSKADGHIFLKNMSGIGPFEFSMDGGKNWQAVDFQQVAAGPATVLGRDANGCVLEKTATVPIIESISVEISDLLLPCDSLRFSFEPTVSGGGSELLFLWENAGGNALGSAKNFTAGGPAQLVFSAINRCETVSKTVKADWDAATIGSLFYAPNAFAPASDLNKNWRVLLADATQVADFQLVVFDRWGNKVFSTTDPAEDWDGTARGKKRQPGVYVWMVEAEIEVCGERRKLHEKGDVTVVR